MGRKLLIFLEIALTIMALLSYADAACPSSGCGDGSGDWDATAQAFLRSDVPMAGRSIQEMADGSSLKMGQAASKSGVNDADYLPKYSTESSMDTPQPACRSDSFPNGMILKSMQSVSSSDMILDVSSSHSNSDAFIRGAISIPSNSFIYDNGTIKRVSEMAKILGDAGVSNDDSVIVYSNSFESGETAFVFWLMKCLGQRSVKLLDGDLYDWAKASLPLDPKPRNLTKASYIARAKPEMLANYDYVKSGIAQMIDARSLKSYGSDSIPHSSWISAGSVLEDGKIKDASQLNDTFAKLDKRRPVVVYSTDIANASLVWYALQLMGFDSKIYSWQDWEAHELPSIDIKNR